MKLRIHTWPENILKKKCKTVDKVDNGIRRMFSAMTALMKISGGIGLAANQAGIDLRLVVIECNDRLFKLVNPFIVKKEGSISFCEGCLSFPGLELRIKRAKRVWVSALDENGEPLDLEAEGLLAVIFQHELDHINGIPFIYRISLFQKFKSYFQLQSIMWRTKNGMHKQAKKY